MEQSSIALADSGRLDESEPLVARLRLVRRLLAARGAPLVALVAPAGYGKTSLLWEWAAVDGRPFAWVPPECLDGEPDALLLGITGAIRAVAPVDGDPVVIVLDDAHRIQSTASLAALNGLIGQLGEGAQIALAARAEPALPLGGLRARRMLVELRTADLAMTHSEAGAVMAARGTELDPAVLDLLVHRTEGWPAALYLAALAMEEEPLAGHGLAEFTGGDRFVADYITDELLAPLSPDMVAFLTRTSVLDRLSGALCDHVLERSGSARLLKKLSRMNLMLVPLDRSDDEYRYHRLFAEALRVELSRREPELARILRARASAWYEHRGDSKRAIEHAIAGGDAPRAGALLWSNAATYAGYGRRDDLDGWLARFSHEQVASSPTLALTAAAQAFVAGDRSLLEHWTAAALRALDGSETDAAGGALEAEILILRAVAEDSVTYMGDCAAAAAPVDSPWRALASLLRGVALHLSGERAEARELLEEGARHSAAAAPHIQALCLAQLALLAIERQDWAAAESLAGRARAQVERAGLREYATSALVYAVASQVEAQGGRVETSQEDLRHASWLLTRGDLGPWYEAECRVALACAALRLGDTPGARTLLSEAERQLERSPDARVPRAWVAACQVQAELSGSAAGTASLTTAELRVLQFLPTHLSFPEMAERLYVSANTVKTHARSVYRKLDASSRGEAVVRARDAGLLDQTSHAGVGTTVRLVGIG